MRESTTIEVVVSDCCITSNDVTRHILPILDYYAHYQQAQFDRLASETDTLTQHFDMMSTHKTLALYAHQGRYPEDALTIAMSEQEFMQFAEMCAQQMHKDEVTQ